MSKIHTGFPPERTVLDRASNRPESRLHVLELVALQFCANLLRLSNLPRVGQAKSFFADSLRATCAFQPPPRGSGFVAAPKSERSTPTSRSLRRAAGRLTGESQLLYLQWIVLAGSVKPGRTLWLRSSLPGQAHRGPPAKHIPLLQSFLTVAHPAPPGKLSGQNDLSDSTGAVTLWQC